MAQNGGVVIDVLARKDGAVISQISDASQDVTLNQLSIVRVHATRDAVASYERVGNDLVIHMKDGRTVRYHSFFDTDGKGHHSELIFDDGVHPIEHAAFVDTGATAGGSRSVRVETPPLVSYCSTLPTLPQSSALSLVLSPRAGLPLPQAAAVVVAVVAAVTMVEAREAITGATTAVTTAVRAGRTAATMAEPVERTAAITAEIPVRQRV